MSHNRKHRCPLLHVPSDKADSRHARSEEHIDDLADYCRKHRDVPRPLLVNPRPSAKPVPPTEEEFDIICGVTSYLAALRAGLTEVSITVPDKPLTEFEVALEMLQENRRRKSLTLPEEGASYAKLMKLMGWNLTKLAVECNIPLSRASIAVASYEGCTPHVFNLIATGQIHSGFGQFLARLTDPIQQNAMAQRIIDEDMKRRAIIRQIDLVLGKPEKKTKPIIGKKGSLKFTFTKPDYAVILADMDALYDAIKLAQKQGKPPESILRLLSA